MTTSKGVPTPDEVVGQDIPVTTSVRPSTEVPIPSHPIAGQMIPDPTPHDNPSRVRTPTGGFTKPPNATDYGVLKRDPRDQTRFRWVVYAGNHQPTHGSRGSYSRKSSAKRALKREQPRLTDIRDWT